MKAAEISENYKQPSSRFVCILPLLLLACAGAFTILMLLSLRYRFLDRFVVGSWHGRIGNDFFSVPRSFLNLINSMSIFRNEGWSDFGPYGAQFVYHPVLSVLLGSWLSLFSPWVSYSLFVGFSVSMLWFSGSLLSNLSDDPIVKAFSFFALICSFPSYLMLWNAQVHVLSVVSISLILVSLMELAKKGLRVPDTAIHRKLLVGMLVSLFSKPIVLLIMPALFLVRKTRRTLLCVIAIYAVVTTVFLCVPALNPEGTNHRHWEFLTHHSNVGYNGNNSDFNTVTDQNNYQFYSLPTQLNHIYNIPLSSMIFKLPILIVGVLSLLLYFVKECSTQLYLLVVVVILSVFSFYTSYARIWEYFYTTLLPTIPVLLVLLRWDGLREKKILKYVFVLSLLIFVPTPNFLDTTNAYRYLDISRLIRVEPILFNFLLLTVFVCANILVGRKVNDAAKH